MPCNPLGEEAQIFDCLHAAEALAERLGDDRRLGRIASQLGIHFSAMGEHDRAIAACQRALALATTSGAFDVQVTAQTWLGQTYYTGGDFRQGLEIARQAMAVLTGEQHSANFGRGSQSAVSSRCYVAGCLAELEGFAEGRGVAEEAVRIAEAIERPLSIASALLWVGLLARRHGDIHQRSSRSNGAWRSATPPTSRVFSPWPPPS